MDRPQEYYRDLKTQYFSLGDILALGMMIATGLYFIITSALKISVMVFGTIDTFDLLINIMGAVAGYGVLFGAYRYVKRATFLKAIADSIFVEAIYERLEPLLADIAETKADYDILSDRIDNLNYNVDDIRKSIEHAKVNPSGDLIPMQYALKTITYQFRYTMLTTATLAVYIFMVYNPAGYVPYVSPVIFILWWGLITAQHDFWEMPKAWYWVAVPLLFVPMFTLLFTAIYSANVMFSALYMGVGLYALSYYVWCEYTARGILPFGIGERMRSIKKMLSEEKVTEVRPEVIKQEVSKPGFRPHYIGSILIIMAIFVFAFSMLGYLIENKLINISWQTIGLDIVWQPLYSYGTMALGVALLALGYVFVVKFRGYK